MRQLGLAGFWARQPQRKHPNVVAAAALHRSLLPATLPSVPGIDLAARYVAGSGNVGGDWYDVFVLPDGKLGVVIGDVAGSGLASAVVMGRMRSALRAYVLETGRITAHGTAEGTETPYHSGGCGRCSGRRIIGTL